MMNFCEVNSILVKALTDKIIGAKLLINLKLKKNFIFKKIAV